jgi:hypothetical protein
MPKISAHFVQAVGIFVLASLVAAGIVIGIIYFVSSRGEQARIDEAREIAQTQVDSEDQETDDQDTASDDPAPIDTASPNADTDQQNTGETSEELPRTGPADTLINLVVIGLVTFSVVSYVRSRSTASKL